MFTHSPCVCRFLAGLFTPRLPRASGVLHRPAALAPCPNRDEALELVQKSWALFCLLCEQVAGAGRALQHPGPALRRRGPVLRWVAEALSLPAQDEASREAAAAPESQAWRRIHSNAGDPSRCATTAHMLPAGLRFPDDAHGVFRLPRCSIPPPRITLCLCNALRRLRGVSPLPDWSVKLQSKARPGPLSLFQSLQLQWVPEVLLALRSLCQVSAVRREQALSKACEIGVGRFPFHVPGL